ncbi:DDB2 isoform 13 [Pongo abelii]|uniref:DDB2 isoform 13 n=1 Tax=Pongo abelii TaxID=9601 RepID=A0A2J8WF06_PONAB|nr:DDB2 isoform 13 [Pongo abelii]
MAPKKRPETQKTSEIVLRPRNMRSRSPRELEPEAKKLCAKGSDHTDMERPQEMMRQRLTMLNETRLPFGEFSRKTFREIGEENMSVLLGRS